MDPNTVLDTDPNPEGEKNVGQKTGKNFHTMIELACKAPCKST